MFAVERWNDYVEQNDGTTRGDGERTPQFAAPTRAQLSPAPAGSAARRVGLPEKLYTILCYLLLQGHKIGVSCF
jgi:hypothetical protein